MQATGIKRLAQLIPVRLTKLALQVGHANYFQGNIAEKYVHFENAMFMFLGKNIVRSFGCRLYEPFPPSTQTCRLITGLVHS